MRAVFVGLACLGAACASAGELRVTTGQTYLIDQPVLHLERLLLEDGATLRVQPGIEKVQIYAEQAWIGRDVHLLAAGGDGRPGQSGAAATDASGCDDGAPGMDGEAGQAGSSGVSVELALGLRSFGSMRLDTHGGAGGAGGNGGSGGAGGSADTCAGGSGGTGGSAGAGGVGGRGGDVLVRYWSLSADGYIPISNYGPGVQVLTSGGAGAPSGQAGEGGAGGTGQLVKRPTGIKVFRNPGIAGQPGAAAAYGEAGASGHFLIQPQAAP
ncbi:hypothetical protein [Aquipseudomonas ullengensis]|uniref:PE-PGRS family protein n=1 Tax=Aquipseudomonas ullengensis TaxID=2759166 RepID=A0A7W4QC51_9GAMM|nr:hypothetical protein [Pseudomonas ullengensis]MBB2497160.1 hypothetical protein [Pseudomonas ullengensis]